jgi:hypothetical protein
MDRPTLEKLFDKAAKNVSSTKILGTLCQGKMYELYVLIFVLKKLKKAGYTISVANAPGGKVRLPGAPAKPDKTVYTYFTAALQGYHAYEIWVSLEVTCLSDELAGAGGMVKSAYHEVDVGVFKGVLTNKHRPSFRQLALACTCKFTPISKAQVREALGLRRETGLLLSGSFASEAPWYVSSVPADPAVPVVLFSKDPAASSLRNPIDEFGLYVEYLLMP